MSFNESIGMKQNDLINNLAAINPRKYHFPMNTYKVDTTFICNLKYTNDTPQAERKINLNIYKCILTNGQMDLVSYNEKSGLYEYKLLMLPSSMSNNNADSPRYFSVKGKVTIDHNKNYLPLKGKVQFVNGWPVLQNLVGEGSDYFSLEFNSEKSYNMNLIRQKDIPVTVEIDWFDEKIKT